MKGFWRGGLIGGSIGFVLGYLGVSLWLIIPACVVGGMIDQAIDTYRD